MSTTKNTAKTSTRWSIWNELLSSLRFRSKAFWMTTIYFCEMVRANRLKAIRMKLGLTQKEYADKLDVSLGSLKQWEQNRKQIFKSTWEKYFKHSLESCG